MRQTLANSARLLLLVGLAGWGCSSTEKIRLTENGAPDFKQLAIVYDVNSVGGLARLEEPPGMQQVGLVESRQPAGPPTRLHLEVQYPYPGVHPDFVHVTLRSLAPGQNPNDLGIRDAPPPGLRGFSNANSRGGGLLSITVGSPPHAGPASRGRMPRHRYAEDGIARALPRSRQRRASSAPRTSKGCTSHLAMMYNKGQIEKTWVKEPRLEQLVTLLKRHGTLTAYQPHSRPHSRLLHGPHRENVRRRERCGRFVCLTIPMSAPKRRPPCGSLP